MLDTVGWVIGPVKIVPDMTYNVFGGTLNPTLLLLLLGDDIDSNFCALGAWNNGGRTQVNTGEPSEIVRGPSRVSVEPNSRVTFFLTW